ncbi:unnamed protein product [Sphagnum tenellum]
MVLGNHTSGRAGKMLAVKKEESTGHQEASKERAFKWGVKVVDEDHQYRSFSLMGEQYEQYDCVCCHSKGSGDWLGKIMELEEANNHKLCKLRRFVPGSEVPPGTAGLTHLPQPKEVFLAAGRTTAVETVNILEVIVKKCRVLCVAEHNFNIVPTIEIVQAADHFFSKAYDGDRKQIVSLENLADLIGAQRVFNKKEWVMDEVRDRVPTTSNQAKGVKEDLLASRSLAKKPQGKRQREGMSALHEGGALESPHSTSQPMKKPKLSKHPISVARAGEDPTARSSKVLVPASRPLREAMSALHDRTVVGSPGSTLQLLKKPKISKYPNFQSRTGDDPAPGSSKLSAPGSQLLRGLVQAKGIVSELRKREPFGGKEKVKPVKQVEVSEPLAVHRKEKVKPVKQVEVSEPLAVHRKEKVKDIVSIYVGASEHMPAVDQEKATVEAAKECQKTEARDTAQVQRSVFKVVREPWESSIEKAVRDRKVLHLTNLDPQLNAADIEDLLNPFLRVTCEARILHPPSYRHFHSLEALVKFPNAKIAETTVREMKEKCLIMGDRPVAVSFALATDEFSKSSRFPGHILLKAKALEDHKNAVATSHGAQGNTIEFTCGLQWRVLQEQQDVQWRKIALEQMQEMRGSREKK